jgi:GNAT superfamily N-acetyltransferase
MPNIQSDDEFDDEFNDTVLLHSSSRRREHSGTLCDRTSSCRLLKGYAPESVLTETTDEHTFADAAREGRLWVALKRDVPVGFALVKMLADDLPHLEELDIDPSHGRRGVGTALVRAVCKWAADSGYTMLTLSTFRAVPWNFAFYAR